MNIEPEKEYILTVKSFYDEVENLDYLSEKELEALKQFITKDNELVFPVGTKIIFEDESGSKGKICGVSLDLYFEDIDDSVIKVIE